MAQPRVTLIGTGNVASHLAHALHGCGCKLQIYSRTPDHAAALAEAIGAEFAQTTQDIHTDSDFYIISVNDDSIADVAAMLADVDGIVMHTSGSVPIDVIANYCRRAAVLYPLQTFSKGMPVDMRQVPIFTEATDSDSLARVDGLAAGISDHVLHADSAHRTTLHVAAVFACNFANHLWTIADDILGGSGYSLDVLYPLLQVTLDKAMSVNPDRAQTGPARRGDLDIINKHISTLPPDQAHIYRMLSESIVKRYINNTYPNSDSLTINNNKQNEPN